MPVVFTDYIYNSILMLSFFNALYLYTVPLLTILYNTKFVYPLIFIKLSDIYIKNNINIEKYGVKKKEIINCYNACIHAIVILGYSLMYIYKFIDNEIYNNGLSYSVIYNILDIMTLILSDSKIKNQMIFHHILLITSSSLPYFIDVPYNYKYYIALNYLSEVTTVPLNLSWILYLKEKTNTLKFKIYIIITLILYLPFRVFLNTYLFYDEFYNLDTNLKYCQLTIMFLNYFWFYKLFKKVYSNLFN